MKLGPTVNQYILYRQSLGEKFKTNRSCLRAFCKSVGADARLETVTESMVSQFLYKSAENKVTTAWFVKHTALRIRSKKRILWGR